uniref:VWFA domain-containing protein n=1 Tax=Macrostomum lignano TaxID=282301 RepID=A0A1I8FUP2_9PLAT
PDADPKLLASHLRALTSLIASAASSAAESAASADYPTVCWLRRSTSIEIRRLTRPPLLRKLAGRVMSFNVRDPLMKFVTGVDLVLAELQRWEAVASHEVSLMTELRQLSGVIIEWRRMELNRKLESCSSWKACLDHCQWRFRQSAARWLLPLAGILNDCTQPAQKCNASQLCQSLCQFLDRASLGDFSARLDCVGLLERLSDDWLLDDQCRSVLANARAYYAQYLPAVAAAARERRAGDFIKIVKWSDMNFWSVRASVDRSHRAVLKAVKQLEELLRESALSAGCFSLPESANHKSTNSDVDLSEGDEVAHFATQLTAELAKPTTVVVSSELAKFEAEFLPRSPQLAERIRRLAPTSAASEAAAAVTSSVSGVAELCQRIVESSRQLRDMAPEQTDSRERYERQASQIQRLKRKALSDLFKTLQQAGLSYRKGRLAALSSLDEHRCLLFSFASFHQRDCHAGQHLLRGMHRRLAMTSTLTGGACTKELGLDGIERCDGFSLHLQRLLADLCRL